MDYTAIIRSQYLSALEMLKQTISRCPEAIWNDPADKTKFWRIAYHVLFFTHLYLQDSLGTFKPWALHRKDYESLGPLPQPPHDMPKIGEPYDQETVLTYLAFCQQQVAEQVPGLNMEAESGFHWLPCNKLELQIYNIRHLQQHTGELMDRLGTRAGIELDWVSMQHA
jgi:hypothetical protein